MTKTVVHVTTVPQTLHFLTGHIEHQMRLGWNVVVVSSSDDGQLKTFADRLGCRHFNVEMSRSVSPRADLIALVRLISLLRRLRPHIVHAYTPKAGLLAPIAARVVNVPGVVVSIFGLRQMTVRGVGRRILDTTTRLSTAAADVVWCDSLSMREFVVTHRLAPRKKVLVLGSGSVAGVDYVDAFNADHYDRVALRSRLGLHKEDFVIGFVGRLHNDKGMRELAAAWVELQRRYPRAHLLFVGPRDGDLPPQVVQDLTTGERTHWLGRRDDVPACLASMDLFVMPSYREGFCVSNIEASAMALPVVSTLVPGCVDSVVHDATGALVLPRDASALIQAIVKYIDDPVTMRKHGEQGRRRVVSDFTPRDYWIELSDLYETLLARNVDSAARKPVKRRWR